MTAQEFGDRIRETRVQAGLSVEDVAARIKLSAKTLQAVEGGDFSFLPHQVYARSFVKSYARAVGLPDEELEEALAEFFPLESHEVEPGPADQPQGGKRFVDRLIVFLLILLVVGLPLTAGYFVVTRYGSDIVDATKKALSATRVGNGPETSAPEGVNATVVGIMPEPAPLEATLAEQVEIPAEALPDASPTGTGQDARPVENATGVSPAASGTAPAQTAAVSTAAPASGHALGVTATDACWMEVMADGNRREFIIQPGESLSFPFSQSLTVTLGNAGGVRFTYDGQPFPISTRSGEVRRYVFPPAP